MSSIALDLVQRDRSTVEPPRADVCGLNCLSIDVEEYFHCEAFVDCLPAARWPEMEHRALPCLERIADQLSQHEARATFFVLGWMVEHILPYLRELVRNGHEIACHGDQHAHLRRMTPASLREDLKRARGRLSDALGVRVSGYRAPTFSLTRATAWAADVIAEAGFEYDASVFPIRHDRYGVPDAPAEPFWLRAPGGARLLEFPPLTVGWSLMRIPVGGGGYLRLLPGWLLRRCVARAQARGSAVMIYLHPWELDPQQPVLPLGSLAQWRHRVNLHATEAKLDRLLAEFAFDTAANVLTRVRTLRALPEYTLRPQ